MPTAKKTTPQYDWRRGGLIYQVYPRSFKSSGGAEVGDLKGVTEKLGYIKSLGVDAIWLSPFFKSPMRDYGYDVSDYCQVDPLFGNLKDFDTMLSKAHKLGIKIVVDMIMCHTSEDHDWFKESRVSRTNPKADWYVWADPKPDGSPPNNWQSIFGGPSWTFCVERSQYYFHNFLKEQPHVNLHSKKARDAVLDATRFWLDRGVDGVRLDAAAHYFYDPRLRDNPPNKKAGKMDASMYKATPYMMQLHVNDTSEHHSLKFMEEIRTLLDKYEDRIAIGELGGQEGLRMSAVYTNGPKRLHTAYNFNLITGDKPSAARIRDTLEKFGEHGPESWPSWAFSNHDVFRVASRWHDDKNGFNHDPRLSKCLNAALLSLRGTIFMYQGEELGLPEVEIPFDAIQDPFGKTVWPLPGRDGCRTPMPWEKKPKLGGFTTGKRAWLPVPDEHRRLAVDAQEADKHSTLNFTRSISAWRKARPAMITGDIKFLKTSDDRTLAFTRHLDGQSVLCVFNMAEKGMTYTLPKNFLAKEVFDAGKLTGRPLDRDLFLPGYGVYVAAAV